MAHALSNHKHCLVGADQESRFWSDRPTASARRSIWFHDKVGRTWLVGVGVLLVRGYPKVSSKMHLTIKLFLCYYFKTPHASDLAIFGRRKLYYKINCKFCRWNFFLQFMLALPISIYFSGLAISSIAHTDTLFNAVFYVAGRDEAVLCVHQPALYSQVDRVRSVVAPWPKPSMFRF